MAELNKVETTKRNAKDKWNKSFFFGEINQTDRPLVRLTEKRREELQIRSVSNETGDTTTNTIETQKVIKGYYEHLYAHKLENLEEINNSWKHVNSQDWIRKKLKPWIDQYWLLKLN